MADMPSNSPQPPAMADNVSPIEPSPAHETADVDGRRIWLTGGILAATIVVVGFAASGALRLFRHETDRPLFATNTTPTQMPSPPLQGAPALDLKALRAQKHAMLNEYRWIDRDKGVVRIPIEQAMALLIARSAVQSQ
jgi:hypothetical protein